MKTLTARRRHPASAIVVVLLALTLIGVSYAAIGSATTAQAASDSDKAAAAELLAGRELFIEGCSSCHGLGAQGGPAAPSLIGVGSAAVDFQVSTSRMPLAAPQAQAPQKPQIYTDEEIQAMAAWVGSLSPGPAIPSLKDLDTSDADLTLGGELFRTNCSQCHNFAGVGGALSDGTYGPNLRDATPKQIYEAMITGPESMPMFSNGTLTTSDKQAIIKFVRHTAEEPSYGGWNLGLLGPVSEGAFVWVALLGALIAAAVWIGMKVR